LNNLRDFILHFCEKYSDKTAYTFLSKDKLKQISFNYLKKNIELLSNYFNFKKYNTVAICGANSYEWVLTYFATIHNAGVTVPLDRNISDEEFKRQLIETHSNVCFYGYERVKTINQIKTICPTCDFICLNTIQSIICNHKMADQNDVIVSGQDLATIVYSSGTTGLSKGIMLSHSNIISDTCASAKKYVMEGNTILILPLHHMFGLLSGIFLSMYHGQTVHISNGIRYFFNDMKTYSPQTLYLVPLIVENLYKGIEQALIKKKIKTLINAMVVISNFLRKIKIDIRKILFTSIIKQFGGKLQNIICGGAPLNPLHAEVLENYGINVLNGYGITECSPVVSVNTIKSNLFGSVGEVLECCHVKILDPDKEGKGEVAVRGDNVMLGYLNLPDETIKVFHDQYFKTGDIGFFKNEHLYICGRIKNLIILSNGENVPAEELENILLEYDSIKEVIAYQENDKITIEVFPIDGKTYDDVYKDVLEANTLLPDYKRIQKIHIRKTEFYKTTSQKIIRNKVNY